MNTDKAKILGDYLSLFNYPQAVAQPMGNPGMPVVYAQQMPPGQVAAPAPPQGMVQLSAQPQPPMPLQPEPVVIPQPQPQLQYAAPQLVPAPVAQVPAVNIGQPTVPGAVAPVIGGPDDLLRQNQAYRAQIVQFQAQDAQRTQSANEQHLAALKPMERIDARMQLLQQQYDSAAELANQWRVDSTRKDIELQHKGRIDKTRLDTSSIEALEASVPTAVASYAEMETDILHRLRQEMGMNTQLAVEGLPPAPGMVGLPASNRGGAVPQGQNPMGYQPQQHPMMARDNYLQYTPNASHGRVYQPQGQMPSPMPVAGGQLFPPQYPQPAHQQQYAAQQQQYQGYASPPVQLVPQNQMGQPQMMPQQGVEEAKATARASIMAARKGGSAALAAQGLREPQSQSYALAAHGGASPVNHGAMPDPSAFTGAAGMHPMHLASGGV